MEGGSREGEGYKIRKGRGGYELKRVGIGKVKDKEILICCMIYSIQLNLVNKHLFYFYPSILLSFYLSILLSFYPAILQSFYPSIRLSTYPPILLSFYPSIRLSVYPSILLSFNPTIFISLSRFETFYRNLFYCNNRFIYKMCVYVVHGSLPSSHFYETQPISVLIKNLI